MQDIKFDHDKVRLDLIPTELIEEVGKVLTFGAKKYKANSWRNAAPEDLSRFVAAAMRHIEAYRKGEKLDPESGLPHLAHAATNLGFLLALDEPDAMQLLLNKLEGLKFDRILAIVRGGLVPATYIAHHLGIKEIDIAYKDVHCTYENDIKLLVVDDISDTGATLSKITKNLHCEFSTATVHMRHSTNYKPDYVGAVIYDERWIVYPWEKE